MSWKHFVQVLWLVLPLSLTERFTVSGPALPVPAIAGSDVVLDCKCSTDLPREGVEVRWFRTSYDSPVYLYKEGRHQLRKQDEAYRHRTQLFVEEFINGNVSLRLEDVRVSDNGEYTCFVEYAGSYQDVLIELKVTVLGRQPWIHVDGQHSDGVRLLCESSGWFPAPEVLWFDDQGNNLTTLSNWTVREDSKGLYSVKSQIEIIHSTNKIRCLIHNSENEQEAKLQISDEFFPKVPVGLVVSSLLLGLAIMVLSVLVGYSVKQRREINDLEKRVGLKRICKCAGKSLSDQTTNIQHSDSHHPTHNHITPHNIQTLTHIPLTTPHTHPYIILHTPSHPLTHKPSQPIPHKHPHIPAHPHTHPIHPTLTNTHILTQPHIPPLTNSHIPTSHTHNPDAHILTSPQYTLISTLHYPRLTFPIHTTSHRSRTLPQNTHTRLYIPQHPHILHTQTQIHTNLPTHFHITLTPNTPAHTHIPSTHKHNLTSPLHILSHPLIPPHTLTSLIPPTASHPPHIQYHATHTSSYTPTHSHNSPHTLTPPTHTINPPHKPSHPPTPYTLISLPTKNPHITPDTTSLSLTHTLTTPPHKQPHMPPTHNFSSLPAHPHKNPHSPSLSSPHTPQNFPTQTTLHYPHTQPHIPPTQSHKSTHTPSPHPPPPHTHLPHTHTHSPPSHTLTYLPHTHPHINSPHTHILHTQSSHPFPTHPHIPTHLTSPHTHPHIPPQIHVQTPPKTLTSSTNPRIHPHIPSHAPSHLSSHLPPNTLISPHTQLSHIPPTHTLTLGFPEFEI
uniref:Butyrophilin subfamily 1 member A1-like n=1 Tax=Callorhinchus milii TaxID=7868 RepID=A0A4W3IW47_CALMI